MHSMGLGTKRCTGRDEWALLGKLGRIWSEGAPIANESLAANDVAAEYLHSEVRESDRPTNKCNQTVKFAHAAIEHIGMPRLCVTLYSLRNNNKLKRSSRGSEKTTYLAGNDYVAHAGTALVIKCTEVVILYLVGLILEVCHHLVVLGGQIGRAHV